MNTKYKISLLAVFFISFFLTFTLYTSADLRAQRIIPIKLTATTLSFSQQHTANNAPIDSLFNTVGIRPGGFDVKAVRIQKTGKMNMKYRLSMVKTGGSDPFCNELKLQVLYKGAQKFDGKLKDVTIDSQLQGTERDDWIFFISFDNENVALKNKGCEFDFQFKTYRNDPSEQPSGFYAIKKLSNSITSWL